MNWRRSVIAILAVGALAAAAALAPAQGGGQGRGGFGGQRGFGGQFGGSDTSGLGLLNREDVQRDLNLTPDQKSKLQALQEKSREEIRAAMQDMMGGGGPPDRQEMQAMMEKYQAAQKKEVDKILTPEQSKRLFEIRVQLAGNRAITMPDVQKELGINDQQKAKIADLQAKQAEANQSLFQEMRDGGMDRDQLRERMQKNNEVLDAELGKVLTDGQRAKLKEMAGKPFKADPPVDR
ncbi:MAG: Spy/CpxP family protein refolding chaperone [Fimbriimonadaceae bacterium]|nr:Spy/CpxP family protein refolding chaperone [Fimbriimonadaceae bacterium]